MAGEHPVEEADRGDPLLHQPDEGKPLAQDARCDSVWSPKADAKVLRALRWRVPGAGVVLGRAASAFFF